MRVGHVARRVTAGGSRSRADGRLTQVDWQRCDKAVLTMAAWLLVAGFAVFLVGASFWKPALYQQSLRDALIVMAADKRRLQWIYSWMIAGVLTSMVAVASTSAELIRLGETGLALAAAVLFAVGGTLFIIALCFHLTVDQWASSEVARTGSLPPAFAPWHSWAELLYRLHMRLGYLTAALLGAALLRLDLTPRWFAVGELVAGASCLAGFSLLRGGPFSPPILVHALTAAVGIALLLSV